MCCDPNRNGQFAVSEQEIAAARIEILRIAQKILHYDSARLQTLQPLEEPFDVAYSVVVAHTAVEHFHVLAIRGEHLLDPARHGLVFRDPPAERNRAAKDKDAAHVGVSWGHQSATKAPFVGPDRYRLQQSG